MSTRPQPRTTCCEGAYAWLSHFLPNTREFTAENGLSAMAEVRHVDITIGQKLTFRLLSKASMWRSLPACRGGGIKRWYSDVLLFATYSRHTALSMGTNAFLLAVFSLAVVLCGVAQAVVSQPQPLVRSDGSFKSKTHPDVGLRFVRNSGVCETTPGVGQLSGYIDFGTNMSMVR